MMPEFILHWLGARRVSEYTHATHTGLLLGLGLEYAIDAHWSFKGEYDYINYASKNVSFYDGGFFGSAKIHDTENIVKVGANYRF